MSLISILLVAVAILTLTIGLMTFLGSSANDRKRTVWVFISDIGAALWIISIAVFLGLEATSAHADTIATYSIYGIYIFTLLMVVGIVGYACWQYSGGKIATIASIISSVVMAAILINNHEVLYTSYELLRQGNTVHIVNGWYYWTYAGLLCIMNCFYIGATYYRAKHGTNKNARTGDYILTGGFLVVTSVSAVFNLFLPLIGNYSLIWIGPLSLSVTMLSYFYAILKYRIIAVAAGWLQTLTYVVLMATGAVIYMVIFYVIFAALFKIPNPSTSVLVLNFLMIVIVLLLMPVINEVSAALKSLISVGQVDIAYVIKKLNRIASKNVDLRDLAGFLASHLHFAYIGFVINGRLYGSKALSMSKEEIEHISKMKTTDRGGVWQEPNKSVQKILEETHLNAVAELRNAKGKTFGHLLVGQPLGKKTFERRDLIQLEMIINLVASVIDSSKHIRA